MNDQLPRESLLETIELMVQTAKTYSLPDLESEIGYIRRYYERLQSVEPESPDSVGVESLEFDFYLMLEEHPPLKQLYIASSYAGVLASCICGIESLIELSHARPLTSEELSRKYAGEQARQKVEEELEKALQPLRATAY